MKVSAIVASTLAAVAFAAPAPVQIVERQLDTRVGLTENEYSQRIGGGCRPVIFFWARGSTELGNMGSTVGPPTGEGLKRAFGGSNVAVEGIDYPALISTNLLPGGADLGGIREMKDLINESTRRCPNSKIVVGGYSQGAALCHRAIEDLSDSVKARINGVVLYGDTKNQQDNGQIPNFPRDKVLIICNSGDLVCFGTLTITADHLAYVPRVGEATSFLINKINAAGGI